MLALAQSNFLETAEGMHVRPLAQSAEPGKAADGQPPRPACPGQQNRPTRKCIASVPEMLFHFNSNSAHSPAQYRAALGINWAWRSLGFKSSSVISKRFPAISRLTELTACGGVGLGWPVRLTVPSSAFERWR